MSWFRGLDPGAEVVTLRRACQGREMMGQVRVQESSREVYEHRDLNGEIRLEAVAISGAGARTVGFLAELEREISVPIVGSDSGLYWAIGHEIGASMNTAILGSLTHVDRATR